MMYNRPSLRRSNKQQLGAGKGGQREFVLIFICRVFWFPPVKPCPPAAAASDIYRRPPSGSPVNYLWRVEKSTVMKNQHIRLCMNRTHGNNRSVSGHTSSASQLLEQPGENVTVCQDREFFFIEFSCFYKQTITIYKL